MFTECPFCGADALHATSEGDVYCSDCQRHFNIDEGNREVLRQEIWCRLKHLGATEEEPIVFGDNNPTVIGEECPETVGLSTLEMPHIEAMFVTDDGVVWYRIKGDTTTNGDGWQDIDGQLDTHDLDNILESIDFETME